MFYTIDYFDGTEIHRRIAHSLGDLESVLEELVYIEEVVNFVLSELACGKNETTCHFLDEWVTVTAEAF